MTDELHQSGPCLFASSLVALGAAVRVICAPGSRRRADRAVRPNSIVPDERPIYLTAYGTGIRNRSSLDNFSATIGGVSLPVEYAGPGGGVPGLDQVNVRLTSALKGNRRPGLGVNG